MTIRGIVYAVQGVSFGVKTGEALGIVGESGCGKSVSVKSILRLHDEKKTETSGQILFAGKNILTMSGKELKNLRGGKIGMVFQDPMSALNPTMRIGEQIAEILREKKVMTRQQANVETLRLLDRMGITPAQERYRQYPFEFSGGMLQRITIAMAISCKPSLLIADESTTALDVTIQAEILELLGQLKQQAKMALIVVTHNFGVVAEICEKVAVMYVGRIVEYGSVCKIYDNPRHPYTQALLGSVPKLGKTKDGLTSIPGMPPSLYQRQAGCPFAPRCARATEKCAKFDGEVTALEEDHLYSCIRK